MSYFVAIKTRQSEEALLKNDLDDTSDRPTFQKGSTARKSDRFRRGPASDALLKQSITDKKGTILIVDISG
ncbi:hypothetical protein GCM10028806_26810 [Spirosoma terrae]|uniref:Uncharacterized protein n=1 Tax=Spirosoma terrae TaxID=1968276 RepID=A0A6L9LKU3_9BACT|nr:hypothetical protein [Spirosoma terrae]NDU97359.1 hypothetical protein [Spirosoma terrae]